MSEKVEVVKTKSLNLGPFLIPILSILVALIFGAILIWIQHINPLLTYKVLFSTAFGSVKGISTTLAKQRH